jgi:hypothetical protein
MSKKLTIAVPDEVYANLHRRLSRGRMIRFIDQIVHEHLDRNSSEYLLNASEEELGRGCVDAEADVQREWKALEWCEAFIGETLDDENFGDWPGYPKR